MKIVYLTHDINPKDGWGRYASDLIHGVKNSGHDVLILKEQDDGFEGIPILKRGLGVFSSALKVRKFIKNCDIIHALDGYPYGIVGVIANFGIGKKLVITGVGTYAVEPLYNFKTASLLKWAYRKSGRVVTISNFTKSEILKKVKINNIKVINPGLDFRKFNRLHLEISEKFILSVGALKKRKGYHISIPAFALAKKEIPNLKYKIVGSQEDRNYFNYLKELAKENRVEDSAEFLGNLADEELKKLYQTARLFVLTSVNHSHHFEGFGLVFLEAAAAGLPVIGTKGNGIEDSVKGGYNGILVEQNDIEGTARAMIGLLNDKDRRLTMSKNSYEWAKSNDMDSMVKRYLDIYKNI
ncbi:MAG: hypothetical protein A3D40_02705 [Parcubacteria group bacterium RIFCSPHIGHO2_02_FULL_40_12]|nr:MAG: hypothetical protein A3D40_02705 [Parcubacteria group bacterium RIFCSPHIGHO2_02_FULL_40_12]OHB22968.1 MAG: hypothetical protein A3I22_00850 [Parcubacteria group bacterium RIFCSPLOWO2_02_FULL_40_12]